MISIPPEDAARLEPYLPYGLVLPEEAGAPERAEGAFKRMLLGNAIAPGQKVPLDAIAAGLGVSRTPVREAMRRLEAAGLVEALPNRGFVVRRTGIAATRQQFETRLCIEAFAAGRAFERRDDAFLRELAALQEIYRRTLSGAPGRRRLGMLADKAFHVRISQQAGNPFLTALQVNVFDLIIFTRALEGFPLSRMEEAIAEHDTIVDAMGGSDAARVRRAAARHVEKGAAAIVAYLEAQDAERLVV